MGGKGRDDAPCCYRRTMQLHETSATARDDPAHQLLCPPPANKTTPQGPWKQQLVRCGYDPRTTPDARRYQAVSYRSPNEWHERVKRLKASGAQLVEPTQEQLSRWGNGWWG